MNKANQVSCLLIRATQWAIFTPITAIYENHKSLACPLLRFSSELLIAVTCDPQIPDISKIGDQNKRAICDNREMCPLQRLPSAGQFDRSNMRTNLHFSVNLHILLEMCQNKCLPLHVKSYCIRSVSLKKNRLLTLYGFSKGKILYPAVLIFPFTSTVNTLGVAEKA